MKKFLFLVTIIFAFSFSSEINVVYKDNYQESICGDDYSCEALKCSYKDTNILNACKHYLKTIFLNLQDDKNRYNIYKKAIGEIKLPSVGEVLNLTYGYKPENFKNETICYFKLNRLSENMLELNYNDCSNEASFIVTFEQAEYDVEVVLKGDNGS